MPARPGRPHERSTALPGIDPPPRRLQDRESYFLAAYVLLGEGGQSAVTIPALCDRLGVTKGSFYHHFADLAAFVSAFAVRWRDWVIALLNAYDAEPHSLRRLELLANSHLVAINGPEPAVRAWARVDPSVAEAVREVDTRGFEVSLRAFGEIVGSEAAVLPTLLGINVAVGLQQRMGQVDPERYTRMTAELFPSLLGVNVDLVQAPYGLAVRVLGCNGGPAPLPEAFRATSGELSHREHVERAAPLPVRSARSTSRRRLAVEDFFAAARDLLSTQGYDAVATAPLCEALGVTKGSFHHHFDGMDDFVAHMARQWGQFSVEWVGQCAAVYEPLRRLDLLCEPLAREPDPAAAAWHAWGWTNPAIGAAIQQAEQRWEDLLAATLTELGTQTETASLLAGMTVALAVGLQQRQPPLTSSWRLGAVSAWCRHVLRAEPPSLRVWRSGGPMAALPF